jgi:hypothetical protein
LKRGGQANFRNAVAELEGASSAVQRAAHIEELIGHMRAFEARLSQATAPLPELEARLAADSSKMSSELRRERAIHGDGQRSVARGQASVGIHQIGVAAAQARASVDASLQDLHPASQRLVAETALTRLVCTVKGGTNSPPAPCPRFLEADASLKKSIEDGKAAFAKFDEVWNRESATQQSLMAASDAAVN